MTDFASHRWRDPRWRAEAVAWAAERLNEHGYVVVGEPEQTHLRPWSTVLRVTTDDGVFWFKANAIGTAHEAPLIDALDRWAPGHVVEPLATDPRRGWLLLPDGGATLRAAQGGETRLESWVAILADHAELQRRLAPHAGDLVSLGVPDLRPERLPQVRADLLDDPSALRIGRPGGLPERGDATRHAGPAPTQQPEFPENGDPAGHRHQQQRCRDHAGDRIAFAPELCRTHRQPGPVRVAQPLRPSTSNMS